MGAGSWPAGEAPEGGWLGGGTTRRACYGRWDLPPFLRLSKRRAGPPDGGTAHRKISGLHPRARGQAGGYLMPAACFF
jgi:hypothetical protein